MDEEEVKQRVCERFGIRHIYGDCPIHDEGILTLDGINERGTRYVVARLSDGRVERDVFEDYTGVKILPITNGLSGTIPELRERGMSWQEIAESIMASGIEGKVKETRYE